MNTNQVTTNTIDDDLILDLAISMGREPEDLQRLVARAKYDASCAIGRKWSIRLSRATKRSSGMVFSGTIEAIDVALVRLGRSTRARYFVTLVNGSRSETIPVAKIPVR